MEFFKKNISILTLFALFLFGCNNDSDQENNTLVINITSFQTSYNQVSIGWNIVRPQGIIIQDLKIYRKSKNNENDNSPEELIANLPSNEITFIDNNVPYKTEVSYKIKIIYTDERKSPIENFNLESEQKKFIREIVKFDRVPFQVQKDPIQDDIFHVLDKEGIGYIKRYNASQNQISNTKEFTNGSLLNNKFQIINNTDIYVADTQGKILRMYAGNYQTIGTYSATITDNLNAFAVDGDRIYYQDEEIWKFYTISNGLSSVGHIATSIDYSEMIGNHNFLFLNSQNGSSMQIQYFDPLNCTDSGCMPNFIADTHLTNLAYNAVDPNIFTWNTSKTKLITSIDGRIFNISNLQQEVKLSDITGKKYFQFAFDNNNNVYATVQGEKKIHKFNADHQLIETITTKLYPFFPMVTNNGLKVIGGYEPISYWSFEYGYNFNFNVKCAIETF